MSNFTESRLIEVFKARGFFTRDDIFDFYRHFEPDLKEGTFGWRIFDLKNRNVIRPVKRGLYEISNKPTYTPEISPELMKLAKRITGRLGDIKHCIWETAWLNEFSQHQSNKRIILIEIEKAFVESLYYELKDSTKNEIFLNLDDNTIDFYIAESAYPVVIKKLISRSPIAGRTEKKVTFYTPLLEKILVDIFAEEKLFFYLQGSELMHIYENAISKYSINFTTLFSYAKRREREQDIKQFMSNHMYQLVKDFI